MATYILIALAGGPDTDWDLRNYHYYSGYTFLHAGFDQNIFPAQIQSWFNPLPDALLVFLMEHLPPMLATAVLVFLQSLSVPLLALLLWQCLPHRRSPASKILLTAALLIGASGAMTLSELGDSFADNLIAAPLLAGLVSLGEAYKSTNRRTYYTGTGLGGFCLGVVLGLKMTAAVFAPAFALCLLASGLRLPRTYGAMILFAAAALAGLLITDGFWLMHLWHSTGNPFFPALNGVFHSPWIGVNGNFLDLRFRPKSFAGLLKFPVALALGEAPGSEVAYYDLRLALACLAFPVLVYLGLKKKLRGWPLTVAAFFYVSFILWLALFGVMRYAVPLEYLSAIVLIAAIGLVPTVRLQAYALSAVALLLFLTTQIPQWGPHLAWDDVKQGNWFMPDIPDDINQPNAMFLMMTGGAMSYVIPSFHNQALFVRMEGNLNPVLGTVLYDTRLQALEQHRGPIFTLAPNMIDTDEDGLLNTYNLQRSKAACIPITTVIEVLFACPVERL